MTGFSAIEVTVVEYTDAYKQRCYTSDFTMVHPEAYDEYHVAVPDGSGTFTEEFEVSSDGKTIRNSINGSVKIIRMVGHR